MLIYTLNFSFVMLFSYLSIYSPKRFKYKKQLLFFVLLSIISLFIVMGWRKFVGTDYGTYINSFLIINSKSFKQVLLEKDPLFNLIVKVLNLFSQDFLCPMIFFSLSIIVLMIFGIKRNSTNYLLSVFLYITTMAYYGPFNGLRQWLSSALLFFFFKEIQQKKIKILIPIFIAAYLLHSSAIIPILFITILLVFRKQDKIFISLLLTTFLIIFIFYNNVITNITYFLPETSFSHYADVVIQKGYGSNIFRLFVAIVPYLLCLIQYEKIKKINHNIDFLMNLSLINILFYLLSLRHWIFSRFCIFFDIYNILLYPFIFKSFEKKNKIFFGYGLIMFYLVYMFILLHIDSELLPYKSWLFSGVFY